MKKFAIFCCFFESNVVTKNSLTGKVSTILPMTAAAKIVKRSKTVDLFPPLNFPSRFLTAFTLILDTTRLRVIVIDYNLRRRKAWATWATAYGLAVQGASRLKNF